MKHFTAILTALAIVLGVSACYSTTPVPVHSPASVELTDPTLPATTPVCEEDMPCWDCSTMGNKVCSLDADTAAMDAWDSFDHVPSNPNPTAYEMRVDYDRTVHYLPALAATEVLVPSINFLNTYHVFRYSATLLHHA